MCKVRATLSGTEQNRDRTNRRPQPNRKPSQAVPPNPNSQAADPYLGDVKLSEGGGYAADYALRFSAGFGSHVCFALYATLTAPH